MADECFRYLPPDEWIGRDKLASVWNIEGGCVVESAQKDRGGRSGTSSTSTTLKIFLSEEEHAELRRAFGEAELPNRSLLVFQAIHAGLQSSETHLTHRKRTRTVSIHVSREFMATIRARARMYQVTQQSLLRGLLFHYIRNKSWQTTQANTAQQNEEAGR